MFGPRSPSHAFPGGLSLDHVAAPSRLRHFRPHTCHLRQQSGGRTGRCAWRHPERAGSGASSRLASRGFLSNPLEAKGVCDEWFVDDGQVFVRPFQFDPLLRALDAALASSGASRVCTATSRALRGCFARPSARWGFRDGTRRTCTTPLTFSPSSPAPRPGVRFWLP